MPDLREQTENLQTWATGGVSGDGVPVLNEQRSSGRRARLRHGKLRPSVAGVQTRNQVRAPPAVRPREVLEVWGRTRRLVPCNRIRRGHDRADFAAFSFRGTRSRLPASRQRVDSRQRAYGCSGSRGKTATLWRNHSRDNSLRDD